MSKNFAYIRVSTNAQDVENQKLEILNLANDKSLGKVTFIDDTVSGKVSWRMRKLGELFNHIQPGDTIIVAELSRLGRSMLEIMEILAKCSDKKIKIYASKGNWTLDDSLQSKIMAMVFAMAAEIERDLISQRTKAALATKKAQGVKLGRPRGPGKSKLDQYRERIQELLDLGVPRTRIAETCNASVRNLRQFIKMRGIHPRKNI